MPYLTLCASHKHPKLNCTEQKILKSAPAKTIVRMFEKKFVCVVSYLKDLVFCCVPVLPSHALLNSIPSLASVKSVHSAMQGIC